MLLFSTLSARAACWLGSFCSSLTRQMASMRAEGARTDRFFLYSASTRVGVCAAYYEARVEFTSNTSALLAQAISRLTADKAGAEAVQCVK